MAVYFHGRRELASGVIEANERVSVHYQIEEWWYPLIDDSASCGAAGSYVVKRSLGVSKSHRDMLESALSGSIGPRDIAQVKSNLSSAIETTFKWDYEESDEYTLEYQAPVCGTYNLKRYQLVRDTVLTVIDRRWFASASGSVHFSEKLPYFSDMSQSIPDDDRCNCTKEDPGRRPYDGVIQFDAGNISGLMPFRMVKQKIQAEYGGFSAMLSAKARGPFRMRIPLEMIPPDMVILGSLSSSYADAQCVYLFRDSLLASYEPVKKEVLAGTEIRLLSPVKVRKSSRQRKKVKSQDDSLPE